MAVSSFVVRTLAPSDVSAALDVSRGLPKWFNAEGLESIRRDLGIHEGFIAASDHLTLGFATWHPLDDEVADLSWIGVVERERRRGVGTALVASVAGAARRRGLRFLEVATVADSVAYAPYEETRRFYRTRGFGDFRVDPEFYGTGQDRYDRFRLRLPL